MLSLESTRRKFCLHGLAVELACAVPALEEDLQRLLGGFMADQWPEGFIPVSGCIEPYEEETVIRHLSRSARRIDDETGRVELYQDGERFWRIDEQCGLVEVNLLRGQWRSFILPQPLASAARLLDMALLWPLSQLLKKKGLHVLPATSITRGGWGVMLLADFPIEPELRMLISAGYRLVGPRWTALQEENDSPASRVEMLHLPGEVDRASGPLLRSGAGQCATVDLLGEYLGAWQNHAFCDAVLMLEPGRRMQAHMTELNPRQAPRALATAWPLVELQPGRRFPSLAARLAKSSRCCRMQLSRNPQDLLVLLDSLRYSRQHGDAAPAAGSVLRPQRIPLPS